jgi:aspartyl aminopeptidase
MAAYLVAYGSVRLDEKDPWILEPGVSYHVIRGATSLIAFRPGAGSPGDHGYAIAGAHTDSLGLKLRYGTERNDPPMCRVPVDVYGSAILAGWMDRPLALAGRAIISENGITNAVLFNSGIPVGVIPSLAIHLNREMNKGIELNPHHHLPVFVEKLDDLPTTKGGSWVERFLTRELGIDSTTLIGVDGFFYDAQKAIFLGSINPETAPGCFLNAPALDDRVGCCAILDAFCSEKIGMHTQVACFLDAEEVGSKNAQGADSSFVRDILARINLAMGYRAEDFYRAIPRSLSVSVDAAQAFHPAYADKFDKDFSPLLGKGVALKVNVSQRYATESISEALFLNHCREAGIAWQKYMARADMAPGSTIGPISASRLGIATIDIGHPMLSMHAVRETIDIQDHLDMTSVLKTFYSNTKPY